MAIDQRLLEIIAERRQGVPATQEKRPPTAIQHPLRVSPRAPHRADHHHQRSGSRHATCVAIHAPRWTAPEHTSGPGPSPTATSSSSGRPQPPQTQPVVANCCTFDQAPASRSTSSSPVSRCGRMPVRRRDELAGAIGSIGVMAASVRGRVRVRSGVVRALVAVSSVSQMSELRASIRAPRLKPGRYKARIDTGDRST